MLSATVFQYSLKEIVFICIWLFTLIILISHGKKFIDREKNNTILNRAKASQNQSSEIRNRASKYFWILVSLAIAISYTYLMLAGVDFVGPDSSQFTYYSVRDKFYPMPIQAHHGRFFPLAFQEFNIISLFSKSPLVYNLLCAIQFICVFISSFVIIKRYNNIALSLLFVFLLIARPSFVTSFFELIYPERNLIFWLAIFVILLQFFEAQRTRISFCGVLVASQFSLYYKEPMFILIGSFAAIRFLSKFSCSSRRWNLRSLFSFIKSEWLDFCLLLQSLIFFLFYISILLARGFLGTSVQNNYADIRSEGITKLYALTEYTQINQFLVVFTLVIFLRIIYLIISRKSIDILWDPLAIGAIIYCFAYINLKLVSQYYLAPADFLAVLYISWLTHNLIGRNAHNMKLTVAGVMVSLLIVSSLNMSSNLVLSRRKFIDSHVKLAAFLKDYSPSQQTDSTNIFLPVTNDFIAMELSSFLDYKGVELFPKNHHFQSESEGSSPFKILLNEEVGENNQCVSFRPYRCYELHELNPSDLIIFLPDTEGKLPELELKQYLKESDIVFNYRPDLSPLEKFLSLFAYPKNAPDDWMNIYIFRKEA